MYTSSPYTADVTNVYTVRVAGFALLTSGLQGEGLFSQDLSELTKRGEMRENELLHRAIP